MINEDPFPSVALVNIAATDMRAVLNEKENEKFSPNVKIRKVWIPKQFLVPQHICFSVLYICVFFLCLRTSNDLSFRV